MSNGNDNLVTIAANAGVALIAGLLGIFTGVKVHDAKIDAFEKRLDRIEDKLDQLLMRDHR